MATWGRIGLVVAAFTLAWCLRAQATPPAAPLVLDAARLRSITADLCDAKDRSAPADVLRGKRLFVYFSASWCGPCRAFTPELCDWYRSHGGGKTCEILFVSLDETDADMFAYMAEDDMPWWGVRFGSATRDDLHRAYAGRGIPDLVLLDAAGRVVADSYVDGKYLGPHAVLAAYDAPR